MRTIEHGMTPGVGTAPPAAARGPQRPDPQADRNRVLRESLITVVAGRLHADTDRVAGPLSGLAQVVTR